MTEHNHSADLWSLRAAIARSQIVVSAIVVSPIGVVSPIVAVAAAQPPIRDFADWCDRQPKNLDGVILEWLHSQAAPRTRTHLS